MSTSLETLSSEKKFDLIFCAYGLYYSPDPKRTLEEARSLLRKNGRIAVVGPFGPNNRQLFDLVRRSGILIGDAVVSIQRDVHVAGSSEVGRGKF